MNFWQPFVERLPEEIDPARPRYDYGIDFVLTPQERDQAAQIAVHLERNQRELNQREEAISQRFTPVREVHA